MHIAIRLCLLTTIASAVIGVKGTQALPVQGQEPNYAPPSQALVEAYRGFLLAHPGTSFEAAPIGGGAYAIRFQGDGACKGNACTTTILLPDVSGTLYQAFNQQVGDLRLLQAKHGKFPWLATDDGGIWKKGGKMYVEDLRSIGQFDVPSHYLGGQTKAAVDTVLQDNKWPENAPYVVAVIPPSGTAPETLIVIPDQTTKQGIDMCEGAACPLWLLTPASGGGWGISAKTSGSGAYAVLYATNAAGGHDIGVADQYGWNQYTWDTVQSHWSLARIVASFPPGGPK